MSFITNLMTMLDSIESDVLLVHQERCVSVRNRNTRCLRCAEVCASKAIAYHNNSFELDSSRCIGCGTCVTACPTGALEIKSPSDDDLIRRVSEMATKTDGHPVIACEPVLRAAEAQANKQHLGILGKRRNKTALVGDTSRVCELPCLGRIDESLLIGLAAHKVNTVTLICDSCDTCQYATGGALMREVVQSARILIEAFKSPMIISIDSEGTARVPLASADAIQNNELSRRDFFRSLKDGSLQAVAAVGQEALVGSSADATGTSGTTGVAGVAGVADATDADQETNALDETTDVFTRLRVNAEGLLPQVIPPRHLRISRYLRYLGEPVVKTIETRTSGSVLIDTERCNSCRMCAVFCPTGALSKSDEAGRYGVIYRAAACVRCRLCEQICPQAAITISTCVPIDQFLGKKAVCYRMKTSQWTPNRPDSLFEKMHMVLGTDKEMCMF
ncbi:MAG: 4Fe-4S binding protein [Coriobacteriales bacterium]|jgi:Fe-S-cluster-containing hydrogenase component 2|nr:4Fe-4S binding protein [Coriobacteriales bacterium]